MQKRIIAKIDSERIGEKSIIYNIVKNNRKSLRL